MPLVSFASAAEFLEVWSLHLRAAWILEEAADGTSGRAVTLDQDWLGKDYHQLLRN